MQEGRAWSEAYYTKALEYLLANQQTQLELKRKDVGLLRTKLEATQSSQRDEVDRAINDALQTPMQLAADTIISLIKKLSADDNGDAAIPLAQVLKQISSGTDMYQPKMLNVSIMPILLPRLSLFHSIACSTGAGQVTSIFGLTRAHNNMRLIGCCAVLAYMPRM